MTPAFLERPCRDLHGCAAWYSAFLDRLPSLRDEANGFIHFELAGIGIALKQSPSTGNELLYFHVPDLAAEVARLAVLGIQPAGETKISAEGYRRALFTDPDGGRVGLFESIAEPPAG